jgi:hypothetical protein
MAKKAEAKADPEGKYVVLQDFVMGHGRGEVVAGKDFGEGQLERLLEQKAVRPAEGDEADQVRVTLKGPEGGPAAARAALKTEADEARARLGALEMEAAAAAAAAPEAEPDADLQERIDAARERFETAHKEMEAAAKEQAEKQAEAGEKGAAKSPRKPASHEVGKGPPPPAPPGRPALEPPKR